MEKRGTWTRRNADHEVSFVFNLCRSRNWEMLTTYPVVITQLRSEVHLVPLINRYGHVNDHRQA
jgi:hypothetical protein